MRGVGRAGALALFVLSLGCHRSEPTDTEQAPVAVPMAAASVAAPVDHLAPGELVEGTEVALGVKLPRDLRLVEAFSDVAYARGLAPVHSLVTYFRARLRDGSLHEGEEAATFEHVHAPARLDRELSVHIGATIGGVRVDFRDTTPPVLPNLPDDTARYRQVGLRPDGKWVDPTHLD
ncbi:MAG: hypothetical protein ACLP1X_25185 [Polyangiaceae bacterium]